MKLTAFCAVFLFLLTGCLVDSMERITKDTRDEVKQTKEGAQIATALEICLNPEVSNSARVAACKPVLLKLPDDRLSDYMGIPLRIMKEDSVRRSVEAAEVDLPNVLYIGGKDEMDFNLELAPTSEELYSVLRMATHQAISDVSLKSMQAGVSGADLDTYRDYGRRLVFVATAILGAVRLADLSSRLAALSQELTLGSLGPANFQIRANQTTSTLAKVVPPNERGRAAAALRTLGKNLSLSEQETSTLERLNEMRLSVRK